MRQLFTIHALNQETGIDRRKLRELFANVEPMQMDGRSAKYTLAQLCDAVRGSGSEDGGQAKTRLTVAQADKTELEVEVLRGNLIPKDDVIRGVGRLVSAARARLLSIPSRFAAVAVSMSEAEIDHGLTTAIHDALAGLAAASSGAVEAATEVDGEPVGGSESAVEPRGKRRSGAMEH